MRKFSSLIAVLIGFCLVADIHASDNQSFERWQNDKFSMFIHFGLYSHLGGVWDGEPVRRGYSEQIQSFAGIFGDWYASVAGEFDPVRFDAAGIAALARQSGMKSVVFTSKHHDGFCMFDTETTDYDSVDATPSGRNYVRELADACAREGLKFGLYFSLIDWNFPYAYPISSHNADFVTPQHHELNKAQVTELLTSYGEISELWFDMGALTPGQSSELYSLVKTLQPDCMVSGRLGNDMYDFAVMADNKLPVEQLHAPWQSAASMFPETWSWRSWQERGEVKDKVAQKLRSLVDVVSRGGNYLLNIGPQADGSVVPFESEVLLEMGRWLEKNGDAIYGTSPSPFRQIPQWGAVTSKGNVLYLLLSGKCPEDGLISLQMPGYKMKRCLTDGVSVKNKGSHILVAVSEEMYSDPVDIKVIRLQLDRDIRPLGTVSRVSSSETLSWKNTSPDYSYSCFDYYSNYRSTVGYNWTLEGKGKIRRVEILHTEDESGRKILLKVGNQRIPVVLGNEEAVDVESAEAELHEQDFLRLRGGVFDASYQLEALDGRVMETMDCNLSEFPSRKFSNYLRRAVLSTEGSGYVIVEVTSCNGVEFLYGGDVMMKHLNPYRTVSRTEKLLLELPSGEHRIGLRSYNRFEKSASCRIALSEDSRIYRTEVVLETPESVDGLAVRISADDGRSMHTDCALHNLIINVF